MRPLDVLTVVFVMLIWGVNFTVAKTGMAEISPILMIFLRFTLVAALLVPFVPRPTPPHEVTPSATMGAIVFKNAEPILNAIPLLANALKPARAQ